MWTGFGEFWIMEQWKCEQRIRGAWVLEFPHGGYELDLEVYHLWVKGNLKKETRFLV